MYVHPAFRTDPDSSLAFAAERGFGLVVAGGTGALQAAHVPFILEREPSGLGRLRFHVARANPFHEVVAQTPDVLIVVSGPDAYVSPDWYVSADQVPTWNYVSVHLYGTAHVLPPEAARAHVDELSALFEARLPPKTPWTTAKMPPARLEAMLRAIVPVEVTLTRVEGQRKLAQHKSAEDRAGVVAGLSARGDAASLAIATLMEEPAQTG